MTIQKIVSYLLDLWAGFLRLANPQPQNQPEIQTQLQQKEILMPNFDLYSATEIRKNISDRDYQLKIIAWVDSYLRPLENDALFLEVCRNRPAGVQNFTTAGIKEVVDRMSSLIDGGTPAHEDGHRYFDALDGAAIISNDPFIALAYRNEIDASFWAAYYHDNSTDVQHRYIDSEWESNHCELGAWRFYHATEGLITEPVRRLASYYIAEHQHLTANKQAKVGMQKVWNDRLFFWDGKPVRIGAWITRWSDRLENGGDAATHLVRHAMAAVDGALVGGLDLHHIDGLYSFKDQLAYLFTPAARSAEFPQMKDGAPVMKDGLPVIDKFPSMLQHLQGYRISAGPKWSLYNQHDNLSPNMRKLMDWKVENSIKLIEIVTNTTGTPDFELFVDQMRMKSGFPNSQSTENAIQMVRDLWNLNTPEDQSHWAQGFEFAHHSYYKWLAVLQDQIFQATDPLVIAFQPLVPELVARVTTI